MKGIHSGYISWLRKAIDTSDHKLSFKEFESYDCRVATVKKHDSQFLSMTCGVPPDSVLGPLLFILHMKDIGKIIC